MTGLIVSAMLLMPVLYIAWDIYRDIRKGYFSQSEESSDD